MKKKLLSLALALTLLFAFASPVYAYTAAEKYDNLLMIAELIKEYALHSSPGDDPVKNGLIAMFEQYPETYDLLMHMMLSRYDDHSMFIPASMYDQAFPSSSSYVGIGVTLEQYGAYVRIAEVSENGNAKKAGLQPGDLIETVDGVNAKNKTIEDLSSLLRGAEDTRVTISVLRGGKSYTYFVKRGYVGVPNFTSKVVEDGVFYMDFSRFADTNTYFQFIFALQDMVNANTRSLILDLRGNPGGDLNMAFNIINRLLPDSTEFFGLIYRNGGGQVFESVTSDGIGVRLNKIIVLIDENTASAAEVIAVSLTDLCYAESVGQTTYGKARGQSHYVFEDSSAAVFTTLALIPPATLDYERVGIAPTHEVQNATLPHPASLCAAVPERVLRPGDVSDDSKKLNDALAALGYQSAPADPRTFSEATLAALNEFQLDHGLAATRYLDAATGRAINQTLAGFSGQTVVYDAQYERALDIAREYAAQPQQYTVDPYGNFWNIDPADELDPAS